MTAVVYFGEMLVASLLAILLLAISQLSVSYGAVLFGGGVIAWTLAEYIVHRFVLHYLAPREHGLHHTSPDGAVLTIFWQIWVCSRSSISSQAAVFLPARSLRTPGICSCTTARITVPIKCLYHCSSTTEATTNSRRETTASAQLFGTMSLER